MNNKPLKLGICSWCYGIGGGAARMETYYHKFYDRRLFEPHIISLTKRPESGPEYDSSIPFIQVDQKDRFSHLLAILQDFDVIQFQGGFDPIVCEAASFLKRPHVLLEVLHNIEPGGLYPNIDGTVGVSNAVQKDQAAGLSYKTILNGIDLDLFPFKGGPKNTDKIILLQVARRSKLAISLDELSSDLYAINPKIELWIVGDAAGESTDNVKFLGVREDVAELYRSAHFTVLLSREEPFGLAAVESMASGTPVILSNSGGFLDIVTDSSCGFLVDGPTREQAIRVISIALETLGKDRYRQLSEKGRNLVEEKFSIQKCVRQYEDYILKLYENKKTQPLVVNQLTRIPANAIVGEALYDLHINDLEALSKRLRFLSYSDQVITDVQVLSNAHRLGQYLKFHKPELLPRELNLYLFCSGDRTEYTCNELLHDLEFVREKGLYQHLYNYFQETRNEFPERWEKLNILQPSDPKENI